MARYAARRLGYLVLTLWLVTTLTFLLMQALPGDPFSEENQRMPPHVLENLKTKFGLDKPYYQQYFIYMKNLVRGDLGNSLHSETSSVRDLIAANWVVSAELGLLALLWAVPGGLLLGVLAALGRNRWPDYLSVVIAVIGVSVPGFIFGTTAQYLVSGRWGLLPVAGWDTPAHRVLPCLALGLGTAAQYARIMRSSMLEVMSQEYIRTARAKGLSRTRVVWVHGVRNALVPIVTLLGPTVVHLTTGSLVIEQIFAIPGLGKHYVEAIANRDYPLIMGTTVFYAALLLVSLFLVDLAYGLVDPRIRLVRGAGEGR